MQTQTRPEQAQPPQSKASGFHAAISTKIKMPPPILASDVLREDLAPFEPGRKASRIWDLAFAGLYLVLGAAFWFGLGPSAEPRAGAVCLAAAAATGVTAIVPFSYLWRAVVGGLIGGAVIVLGLAGHGPLAPMVSEGSSGWSEAFRIVACITVPAALLFRSHYRAYARGRLLLTITLLTALPFVILEGAAVARGPMVASVGAALVLTGLLSSLGALRSTPTNAVAGWCAQSVIGLAALDIGLRELYLAAPPSIGTFAYAITAVAFFASVVPMALGLFQVLAAVYAPEARIAAERHTSAPEEPPPTTVD
jgi:hypothetical protein